MARPETPIHRVSRPRRSDMNLTQSLKDMLNVRMGVDVGSSRTRVFCAGRGVVLNERSFLALSLRTGEVIGAGDNAYNLFGRSPAHVVVKQPVRQGVIEDFDTADRMLSNFFETALTRKPLFGAQIIVVVPTGATDVEKKSFEDLCIQAGAREVRLVESCIASIIGMGLPLSNSRGLAVVVLGGGTTQFAIVSEGEILHSGCERVGGEDLNDAIAAGMRKKFGIVLGYRTLEKLKIELGNVYPMEQETTQEVYGKDVIGGLPRTVFVSSWDIRGMMAAPVERIANSVKTALEKVPADLSEPVQQNGIFLCGGNSMMNGMGNLIEKITGVRCKVSNRGALAAITGVGKIIAEYGRFRQYLSLSATKRFVG